jgi:hypothetical protein
MPGRRKRTDYADITLVRPAFISKEPYKPPEGKCYDEYFSYNASVQRKFCT